MNRRYGAFGLVSAILFGIFSGIGTFTFDYAEGTSYFSTDPRACVNCHIMQPQFDSWTKSSHHAVAGCVDCHLPHETIPKYISKADNGWNHSLAFTLQNFHEPIQIKPRNRRILEHNCVNCHSMVVHEMVAGGTATQSLSCVHCHAHVGHGS
jgi:cytochrome c nitrite reductase small subunit